MATQATTVTAAWTTFAFSVTEQVLAIETARHSLFSSVAPLAVVCVQITKEPTTRSTRVQAGFNGLQDLCAGGLASLTANYFLEKLLVSVVG